MEALGMIETRGLVAAIEAAVNGEIDGQIGDVQFLECVVDDLLDGFGVLHERGFAFDINDRTSLCVFTERSFKTELLIDAQTLIDRAMEGVGDPILIGNALNYAVLRPKVHQRGATERFCRSAIAHEIEIIAL